MFGQQCGTARTTSSVRMYLDGLVELKDSSTGQVPRKSFAGYECAWSWMWCCLIKVVTVITSECRCGQKSAWWQWVENGENDPRRASNVTPSYKNAARGNERQQKQDARLKFAVFQFQFKFTSMFHFIWPTVCPFNAESVAQKCMNNLVCKISFSFHFSILFFSVQLLDQVQLLVQVQLIIFITFYAFEMCSGCC